MSYLAHNVGEAVDKTVTAHPACVRAAMTAAQASEPAATADIVPDPASDTTPPTDAAADGTQDTGVTYTIDLSEKNAGKLRKALDPYLAVASRVGRNTTSRIAARSAAVAPSRSNRDQNQAIREWAAKNGYEVSERGRIRARSSRHSTANADTWRELLPDADDCRQPCVDAVANSTGAELATASPRTYSARVADVESDAAFTATKASTCMANAHVRRAASSTARGQCRAPRGFCVGGPPVSSPFSLGAGRFLRVVVALHLRTARVLI